MKTMKPTPKILSKSKILRGYRCLKFLYLTIHDPKKETPISEDLQSLFDQGNEVGWEARKLFPQGSTMDCKPWEFTESVQKTKQLIEQGEKTIYEAAFLYQGAYSRMDIINYSEESKKWSLYEVKSSTRLKEEHIDDLTLQSWIIANSGLKIEKIHLVHLNSENVFPNLNDLFKIRDVTNQIRENYKNVPEKLKILAESIKQEETPEIFIGEHCLRPNECGFKDHCWKEAQVPHVSILNIPNFQKKWHFFNKGIVDVNDDRICDLNKNQEQMIECHRKKEVFKNCEAIRKSLSSWSYPFIFLDFETIHHAIPKFDKSSPYEHIPFQFSVHILRNEKSHLEHYEFLYDKSDDPRPSLIEELLKVCEKKGSIIAYYKDFEINVIKKMANFSSKYKKELLSLIKRMEDPLPILRKNFYDPKFEFSFSLKKVAPALLGEKFSYETMEIKDGTSAQRAYKKLISDGVKKEEKEIIRKRLLSYCKRDTENLVGITKFLLNQ